MTYKDNSHHRLNRVQPVIQPVGGEFAGAWTGSKQMQQRNQTNSSGSQPRMHAIGFGRLFGMAFSAGLNFDVAQASAWLGLAFS